MNFNKTIFDSFRKDLKEAVKALEEKYGVVIDPKNITYSSNDFTIKLEVANKGYDKQKETFMTYCSMYGLKQQDYMRSVNIDNKVYTLIGLKPGNKYCIMLEDQRTHKVMLYTAAAVKQALN